MRRFASIVILLLWCAGPVWALLPGSDEAQLPACCRRHGAHHCAMTQAGMERATGAEHRLTAPAHCPRYHASAPARTGRFTLVETPHLACLREGRMIIASAQRATLHSSRTSADRGPPYLL